MSYRNIAAGVLFLLLLLTNNVWSQEPENTFGTGIFVTLGDDFINPNVATSFLFERKLSNSIKLKVEYLNYTSSYIDYSNNWTSDKSLGESESINALSTFIMLSPICEKFFSFNLGIAPTIAQNNRAKFISYVSPDEYFDDDGFIIWQELKSILVGISLSIDLDIHLNEKVSVFLEATTYSFIAEGRVINKAGLGVKYNF